MRLIWPSMMMLGTAFLTLAPVAAKQGATQAERQDQFAREVRTAFDALRPAVQIEGRRYDPSSLEELMRRHGVPAASSAIVRDGRVAWAAAFSAADVAAERPATADTLFQAGSLSKPVAATAALKLVEQGRLRLDDPVNKRLTSWRVPDSAVAPGSDVTLRQLLSHTAGLTAQGFGGYSTGTRSPTTVKVLDGVAPANSEAVRIVAKPGSAWRYSGRGFTVAQQLMADVERRPFPDLMERLVLRPFGMSRRTYRQPLPPARVTGAATAYRGDGSPLPGGHHHYPEMAAAGLWTTPTDIGRWMSAVIAAYNGDGRGPLRPETARAMLTPGLGNFGLGIAVLEEEGHLRFRHSGVNEGFRALLIGYPMRREGVVVMTNGDNGSNLFGPVHMAVARLLGWREVKPRVITPAPLTAGERDAVLGR